MDKYQRVGVCAFIKRTDGRFLVIKRSKINDYLPGVWDLPGGEVEFGEDPVNALKREVVEELGLQAKVVKPFFVFTEVQNGVRQQFWLIYECILSEGLIKLDSKEHDIFEWVDANRAKPMAKMIFLGALIEYLLKHGTNNKI